MAEFDNKTTDYSIDFENDYSGSRVIIKDTNTQKIISDTKIIEYHKEFHSILVRLPAEYNARTERFSLLIFTQNELVAYSGTIRKVFNLGYTEIALYSGKQKEDRKATRYSVNITGSVDALVFEIEEGKKKRLKLNKPLDVLVVNMSSSGVLIAAMPDCFRINTLVRLIVTLDNEKTTLYCKIVRFSNININDAQYGCKFFQY